MEGNRRRLRFGQESPVCLSRQNQNVVVIRASLSYTTETVYTENAIGFCIILCPFIFGICPKYEAIRQFWLEVYYLGEKDMIGSAAYKNSAQIAFSYNHAHDGINIMYLKDAQTLVISGWYDNLKPMENSQIGLQEFIDKLGLPVEIVKENVHVS